MGFVENEYLIESIILHLQKKIRNCYCLNVMRILIEHPNEEIDVTRLRHLDAPASMSAYEFDVCGETLPSGISSDHSIPELPIPYTDGQTVREVKKAWMQFYTLECEARMCHDYAKADDYREEREKCQDFLETVITERGKIREIQNQRHDDYVGLHNNFARFLKKVRTINPDYADYIEAHLTIGFTCVWRTR